MNSERGAFHCLFCDHPREDRFAGLLFGLPMCGRCRIDLAFRRYAAFGLDSLANYTALVIYFFVLIVVLPAYLPANPYMFIALIGIALMTLVVIAPLRRDCSFLGGMGKRVCGLRVVNQTELSRISMKASIKRNLVLLIPFGFVAVGIQLLWPGPRLGDRWANSVVLRVRDLSVLLGIAASWCPRCQSHADVDRAGKCGACGLDCLPE